MCVYVCVHSQLTPSFNATFSSTLNVAALYIGVTRTLCWMNWTVCDQQNHWLQWWSPERGNCVSECVLNDAGLNEGSPTNTHTQAAGAFLSQHLLSFWNSNTFQIRRSFGRKSIDPKVWKHTLNSDRQANFGLPVLTKCYLLTFLLPWSMTAQNHIFISYDLQSNFCKHGHCKRQKPEKKADI